MSIRKRGGFYSFEFMERGQRHRGTFNGQDGLAYARTKQDARDYEFEIRIQVRNGTYGKGKEDGLEVFAKFFDCVYLPYAKENTADWKHAEFRGKVLKEFFAGKTFRQVTVMIMVGFINARLKSKTKRGTDRNPVTVYKEVALASAVFRMAVSEGVAESNPCEHLPAATRKKIWARNKRDRFLHADEEPKLFAQLKGRRAHLSSIVSFDLETGLRKSELCRLEVEHVNLSDEPRVFRINNKAISVEPGELLVTKSKNGKPRTIPLTIDAQRIAELQMADVTNKQYLFTSRRTGGMIAEIKTGFTAAVRDAGLEDFRFHDLRHTFATRLNAAGIDPFTIRDLLGHSATAITGDYTHTTSDGRRRAIRALGTNRLNSDSDYVRIAS